MFILREILEDGVAQYSEIGNSFSLVDKNLHEKRFKSEMEYNGFNKDCGIKCLIVKEGTRGVFPVVDEKLEILDGSGNVFIGI